MNHKQNELYKFIRSSQEPRRKFYIRNIILTLIMLVSEFIFFYNTLQFDVTGCLIENSSGDNNNSLSPLLPNVTLSSGSDGSNNNNIDNKNNTYLLSTCINNNVQQCIPILFSTSSDEALSFRVPLIDKYSDKLMFENVFLFGCIALFIAISLMIARTATLLYVKRSRVQLLLTVNVLPTKPKLTLEEKMVNFGLIISVVVYSVFKLVIINSLVDTVSVINCTNNLIKLEFAGKTSNSIIQSLGNLFVFLYLFKSPIQELYEGTTDLYSELKLVDLIRTGNAQIIDDLKKVNTLPVAHIQTAVKLYVSKKYPRETSNQQARRARIFTRFKYTENNDILEAIKEYQLTHPYNFKPLFNNNTNDINNNDIDNDNDNDNENKSLLN